MAIQAGAAVAAEAVAVAAAAVAGRAVEVRETVVLNTSARIAICTILPASPARAFTMPSSRILITLFGQSRKNCDASTASATIRRGRLNPVRDDRSKCA